MTTLKQSKNKVQLIWGGALVLVGIAVFFRIPQVMPKLVEMGHSATTIGFARVCFYLMGFILVGGGLKKIIAHFKPDDNQIEKNANIRDDID